MIYCPACRAPNADSARACQVCGTGLAPTGPTPAAMPLASMSPPAGAHAPAPGSVTELAREVDEGRVGWLGLLYFIFPFAGGIMWLVWRRSRPARARRAGILAILGVVANLVYQALSGFGGT